MSQVGPIPEEDRTHKYHALVAGGTVRAESKPMEKEGACDKPCEHCCLNNDGADATVVHSWELTLLSQRRPRPPQSARVVRGAC